MDETMAGYAREQLAINNRMEKRLWLQVRARVRACACVRVRDSPSLLLSLQEEARRKEEEKHQPKLKPSHAVAPHGEGDGGSRPGRTTREPPAGDGDGSKACMLQ